MLTNYEDWKAFVTARDINTEIPIVRDFDFIQKIAPLFEGFMQGPVDILEDETVVESKTRSIDDLEDSITIFDEMSKTKRLFFYDQLSVRAVKTDEDCNVIPDSQYITFKLRYGELDK